MSSDGAEIKLRSRRCSCKAFVLLAVSCAVCLCLFLEHQRHDALTRHGEVRGPRFLKTSSSSSTPREPGARAGASGVAAAPAAIADSAASTAALSTEGGGELERLRSELETVRAQADAAQAELQELRKQSGSQGGSLGDAHAGGAGDGTRLETTPLATIAATGGVVSNHSNVSFSTAETGVRKTPSSQDLQIASAELQQAAGATPLLFRNAEAKTLEESSVSTPPINLHPIEASKTTSTLMPGEDDSEDVLPIPESLWRQPPEDPEVETVESAEGEDVALQPKVPSTTGQLGGQAEIPAPPSQIVQEPEIIVKAGGSEIRVQVGQAKEEAVPLTLPTLVPTPRSWPSDHEGSGTANGVDGDDHEVSLVANAQAMEPAPAPPSQPEISVKAGGQEIVVTINSDAGSPSAPPSPPPHQPGTTQPILLSQAHSQAEFAVPEATEQLQLTAQSARSSDTFEIPAIAGPSAELKAEVAAPVLAVKPDAAADHSKPGQGGTQITVKSGGQSITIAVVTGGDEVVASSALQPTPAAGNQVEATEASVGSSLAPAVSLEEEQEAASPTLQEENGQPSWLNAPLSGLSDEEQQPDSPKMDEETTNVALAPSDGGDLAPVPQDIVSPASPAEPVTEAPLIESTTTTVPTDEYANLALRAR